MLLTSFRSDVKVVISGPMVEVYEFEKGVTTGFRGRGGRPKALKPPNIQQRRQTLNRARKAIQRLSFANFDINDKFITLTLSETQPSIKQANKDFKHFIQKLHYRFGDFRYLAVLQLQRRGAVHYHMLADLPYINSQVLSTLWDKGSVNIQGIRQVGNVGEYITCHLGNDPYDTRLYGQRLYFTSRNLKKPVTHRGDKAAEIAQGVKTNKEVAAWNFQNPYQGQVNYLEFHLNKESLRELLMME